MAIIHSYWCETEEDRREFDMVDKNGKKIKLGDGLVCDWGYSVTVVEDGNGKWTGKLICEPGDSCEKILYHLNDGKGYAIANKLDK